MPQLVLAWLWALSDPLSWRVADGRPSDVERLLLGLELSTEHRITPGSYLTFPHCSHRKEKPGLKPQPGQRPGPPEARQLLRPRDRMESHREHVHTQQTRVGFYLANLKCQLIDRLAEKR